MNAVSSLTPATSIGAAPESVPSVEIVRLEDEAAAGWDDFVRAAPYATFFHLAGWRQVLERAFGHRCHYLYARRDGRICGVLPLAQVKSLLFGNALVSTPFCVYGGIVSEDDAVRSSLVEAACALAVSLKVDYLEMRNRFNQQPHWPTKKSYVSFRKAIQPDDAANLKGIPRKQRAMVRKGIQAGLKSEPETEVDRLYSMYSESLRNLGTPVFAKGYLETLQAVFSDDCDVLTITCDGRAVASVLSFWFRDEVLPYYGGGIADARGLKANDFMYWELMRRAAGRGARVFDYGRSKIGAGAYNFKRNWGFEPQPLYYQYYLVGAKTMPDLSPNNPKYRYFINAWKRLPLALSRMLGPMLARNLG